MKKLFVLIILFAVMASVSLSAWEASDLAKFPSCMTEKSWLLNFGVGFHNVAYGVLFGKNYIFVPPLQLSLDKNVPLGDKGLPFFFGGTVGYWGHGYKYNNEKWYYSNLTILGRFGYHFNWGVDKLDTYAVARLGWSFNIGDKNLWQTSAYRFYLPDHLRIGVNIGARYYLTDWFGFWAEAGIGTYRSVDIGLAFKF